MTGAGFQNNDELMCSFVVEEIEEAEEEESIVELADGGGNATNETTTALLDASTPAPLDETTEAPTTISPIEEETTTVDPDPASLFSNDSNATTSDPFSFMGAATTSAPPDEITTTAEPPTTTEAPQLVYNDSGSAANSSNVSLYVDMEARRIAAGRPKKYKHKSTHLRYGARSEYKTEAVYHSMSYVTCKTPPSGFPTSDKLRIKVYVVTSQMRSRSWFDLT